MKVAKIFAVVFAVAGIVLMLGTAVVCFASLNAPVKILENPDGAVTCSEELAQALNEGSFAAAGARMYGQPDLGVGDVPADGYSGLLWQSFCDSISLSYTSRLYLLDADLARDGTIRVLDVSYVTEQVQLKAKALLEQKQSQAEDPAALYDETGYFRQELVEEALQTALRQVLQEDPAYVTKDVTVKLIFRDETWWAVPDQALLQAISGQSA